MAVSGYEISDISDQISGNQEVELWSVDWDAEFADEKRCKSETVWERKNAGMEWLGLCSDPSAPARKLRGPTVGMTGWEIPLTARPPVGMTEWRARELRGAGAGMRIGKWCRDGVQQCWTPTRS